MIGRFLSLMFFIIIGYVIFKILKLVFHIGRTTAEINRKADEMRNRKESSKKGNVIELDRDQYKVE